MDIRCRYLLLGHLPDHSWRPFIQPGHGLVNGGKGPSGYAVPFSALFLPWLAVSIGPSGPGRKIPQPGALGMGNKRVCFSDRRRPGKMPRGKHRLPTPDVYGLFPLSLSLDHLPFRFQQKTLLALIYPL